MEMSMRATGLGVGVSVGALLTWWAWRRTNTYSETPTKWEEVGEVSELVIYPLKSGRGVKVTEAEATRYGLAVDLLEDRSFVALTSSGVVRGKFEPKIRTVTLTLEGSMVILQARGEEKTLEFDLQDVTRAGEITEIMCFRSSFGKGYDCGDEAAKWLTRVMQLRGEVRLVYNGDLTCDKQPGKTSRTVEERDETLYTYAHFKPSDRVVYAEHAPYLLTSQTSLAELNSRLLKPASQEWFRPNIIVRGVREPYDEDDWAFVRIGEVVLRRLKPCDRYVYLDPESGLDSWHSDEVVKKTIVGSRLMTGPEVLQRHWKRKPPFGSHLGIDRCGRVQVGDKVAVARASSNPQWQL